MEILKEILGIQVCLLEADKNHHQSWCWELLLAQPRIAWSYLAILAVACFILFDVMIKLSNRQHCQSWGKPTHIPVYPLLEMWWASFTRYLHLFLLRIASWESLFERIIGCYLRACPFLVRWCCPPFTKPHPVLSLLSHIPSFLHHALPHVFWVVI